jgi:hypothetical protein
MRARDLQQNRARDGETSGRTTQGGNSLSATTVVDEHVVRHARKLVGEVGEQLGELEGTLAECAGFFDEGLPAAVVGQMGISAGDIREQLPTLREAARELGRS